MIKKLYKSMLLNKIITKNKKFQKFFRDYNQLIFLILILFVCIVSVNFYNNYKKNQLSKLEKLSSNVYLKKTVISIFEVIKPRYEKINYTVIPGDSLEIILNKINILPKERKNLLILLKKNKKLKRLYLNQQIFFLIDKKKPERVLELKISLSKSKNIIYSRNISTDKFTYKEISKKLTKKIVYNESKIENSLYQTAIELKIKPNIIIDFARIYGFQIDFQRDIWKNDRFQIIYENFLNEKKEIVDTGNIIYANLILQGKEFPLYYFKGKKIEDHFDENGQSIRKTLMKTPINGARLSSGFGKRKHPILGYTKKHMGTDFAAPMNTPIMASGDGKVIKAGWCGGGGNCVKIRHNSTYTTLYAHMSRFGRKIKKGAKVKQGQIIGYVGSTGMSTGPHLHYEVVANGKKINSQKLKLPSGKILKGDERRKFEIVKIKTNVLKSELISKIN